MAVAFDYQAEFNGLTIGDGTEYDIIEVDGLIDLPDVTTSDRPLLLRDGDEAGRDTLGGRSVTLTVDLWPADPRTLGDLVNDFQTAYSKQADTESPWYFQFPGVAGSGSRLFNCRTRKRSAPINLDFVQGHCQFVVQLDGVDPRLYDASSSTLTCGLPTPPGGFTFPLTFPQTFGAMPSGGTLSIVNAGTYETFPTIRVDGPIPSGGFTLTNDTTGDVWTYLDAFDAGQWLDIVMNPARPSAMLNGVASRFTSVDPSSTWWSLAANGGAGSPASNTIKFRAASHTSAQCAVTWSSAWA